MNLFVDIIQFQSAIVRNQVANNERVSATASIFQETQTPAKPSPPAPAPNYINADRPGFANTSFVVDPGRFQIELGLDYEKHDSGGSYDRRLFIPVTLRWGVGKNFEVRLDDNGGFSEQFLSGGQSTGYSPFGLGFKWHLVDPVSARKPSVALFGHFYPKAGSGNFAATSAQGDFSVLIDHDLVPGGLFSIEPNLGVALYDNGNGGTFTNFIYSCTLNFNPTAKTNWFLDMGGQNPELPQGSNGMVVDAGYAWISGTNVQYDVSIGSGVSGTTGARPFIMIGYSRRF